MIIARVVHLSEQSVMGLYNWNFVILCVLLIFFLFQVWLFQMVCWDMQELHWPQSQLLTLLDLVRISF